MNTDKKNEVLKIIQESLELSEEEITVDSTMENVEVWDSLAQLGILSNLDKHFNGRIASIKELADADSIEKIIQLLTDNSII